MKIIITTDGTKEGTKITDADGNIIGGFLRYDLNLSMLNGSLGQVVSELNIDNTPEENLIAEVEVDLRADGAEHYKIPSLGLHVWESKTHIGFVTKYGESSFYKGD